MIGAITGSIIAALPLIRSEFDVLIRDCRRIHLGS
jgi:hypothetical protein